MPYLQLPHVFSHYLLSSHLHSLLPISPSTYFIPLSLLVMTTISNFFHIIIHFYLLIPCSYSPFPLLALLLSSFVVFNYTLPLPPIRLFISVLCYCFCCSSVPTYYIFCDLFLIIMLIRVVLLLLFVPMKCESWKNLKWHLFLSALSLSPGH